MNIVEKISIAKTGQESDNEDAIVIADSFVAVIDGMTPKDHSLYDGESPARIAVHLIAKEIQAFPENLTCSEASKRLTQCIQHYYIKNGILNEVTEHPYKRMCASAIILSKQRHEIWLLGDCHCLINGQHVTNEKLIDSLISDMRSQLIKNYLQNYSIEELLENDKSREDIQPFLMSQYRFQNNRKDSLLSYSVIDGFQMNDDQIKIVHFNHESTIVLASDGYPSLKETLHETEVELQTLLKHDPLLFNIFKSTKGLKGGNISFDDRTYIKIRMN
jgi:serine/threonine protein phosphatase PrpC